ncbi:hypothetical protein ACWERW_15850 [Streptomyces sp. NPDC004012]
MWRRRSPDRPDEPGTIAESRQYIQDFEAVVERATTALEVYDDMLKPTPVPHQPRRALGIGQVRQGLTATP